MQNAFLVITNSDPNLGSEGVDLDLRQWAASQPTSPPLDYPTVETPFPNPYTAIINAGLSTYLSDALAVHRRIAKRFVELASQWDDAHSERS